MIITISNYITLLRVQSDTPILQLPFLILHYREDHLNLCRCKTDTKILKFSENRNYVFLWPIVLSSCLNLCCLILESSNLRCALIHLVEDRVEFTGGKGAD